MRSHLAGRRHWQALLAAVVAGGLVAGCDFHNQGMPAHTITDQQAIARDLQLIQETDAALRPRSALDYAADKILDETKGCTTADTFHEYENEMDWPFRIAAIPSVRPAAEPGIVRQAVAYWKRQGYDASVESLSLKQGGPRGSARTQDGFSLVIDQDGGGSGLDISALPQECIWPNGTPPPTLPPS